jgi:hypothetical protein
LEPKIVDIFKVGAVPARIAAGDEKLRNYSILQAMTVILLCGNLIIALRAIRAGTSPAPTRFFQLPKLKIFTFQCTKPAPPAVAGG